MNEEQKRIFSLFKGKIVGSMPMKVHICTVLSQMPAEIIEFVTKNCWFMGSFDDAFGYVFKGDDLAGQYLVFLSDDLFVQDHRQIYHTIAHELAHVVLGHRNAVSSKQSKEEVAKQEREADEYAQRYGF